jgi:Inhibitor of apoptosis-promoting Bax1
LFGVGKIVLEALVLTSVVVSSLTGYSFWAARKGKDYSYSGPVLLAGLNVLLVTSLLQVLFGLKDDSYKLMIKLLLYFTGLFHSYFCIENLDQSL